MTKKIDYSKEYNFFKNVSYEQQNSIMDICETINCKVGDKLFGAGEEATHIWFVVSGKIELHMEMPDKLTSPQTDTRVQIVQNKNKGDDPRIIGWSTFVPPFKMRLSAYAVSHDTKVLRAKKTKLLEVFEKDPTLGYLFMTSISKVIGKRFQILQEDIVKRMGEEFISGW